MATEFAMKGDEDLEVFSNRFMKNKKHTCSKYYIQAWHQREEIRLSMKCFEKFGLNGNNKTPPPPPPPTKIPTNADVKKWVTDRAKKIREDYAEFEDSSLMKAISSISEGLLNNLVFSCR